MRILMLASEVAPFAKTGGLADVAGSLPKALAALGHDVRVVMPAYSAIEAAAVSGRWGVVTDPVQLRVPIGGGLAPAGIFRAHLPDSDVPVYFVAERALFDRPNLYGYGDDAYRFAFFSRAALDLAIGAWGWRPDVVQAHDWHAAPAIAWLSTAGQADERYRNLPTVLTIHNLMHQGRGPRNVLGYLGIDSRPLIEEWADEVNFMARGIYHATMINTVSPTYAREILTPEYGERLDGLLRYRHFDVHGILNGLDYDTWNPASDSHLAATYDAGSPARKAGNKRALQERLGLAVSDAPLVSMVTRLDPQKGLDITGHVVHLLLNAIAGDAQFVVLGSGADEFESMFRLLAGYHTTEDGRHPALRRGARAAGLRRQRSVPHAVALRAVRPRPDDRDALRHGARRPRYRRPRRHRAGGCHGLHLRPLQRRCLLGRAGPRPQRPSRPAAPRGAPSSSAT